MTQAEEQKEIDYEVSKFKNRLRKLNLKLTHVQVKDIKLVLTGPKPTVHVPWWARIFNRK